MNTQDLNSIDEAVKHLERGLNYVGPERFAIAVCSMRDALQALRTTQLPTVPQPVACASCGDPIKVGICENCDTKSFTQPQPVHGVPDDCQCWSCVKVRNMGKNLNRQEGR